MVVLGEEGREWFRNIIKFVIPRVWSLTQLCRVGIGGTLHPPSKGDNVTPLVVQCLRLWAFSAGVTSLIPGQGTWILHATGQGQKNRDQRSSRSGWDSTVNPKFTKTFMENIIHMRDMKLILARRTKTQHDYILLLTAVQSLSRVQLFCDPMDCSPLGSLVRGISRQEYWSGLPFLPPWDLPDSRIEHVSPALAGRFFTAEPPGKPINYIYLKVKVAQPVRLFMTPWTIQSMEFSRPE